MITIKKLYNDRCSNCNASGVDSHLHEVSISRSNTMQGSTLYYRLCDYCIQEMINELKELLRR